LTYRTLILGGRELRAKLRFLDCPGLQPWGGAFPVSHPVVAAGYATPLTLWKEELFTGPKYPTAGPFKKNGTRAV